jgi:putative transposase
VILRLDGWPAPCAVHGMLVRRIAHEKPEWRDWDWVCLLTVCSRPRGTPQLVDPGVAERIRATLTFHHDAATWRLHAAVVMPDHVHVLLTVPAWLDLAHVVRNWKRYLARMHGVVRQRDFDQHRLRRGAHYGAKLDYLRQTPVRAGLVDRPEDWPYFWTW